ncbi:HNH endonuclease [Chondromyces apiculatus]|uniref:HNH endonuclease n=1 Tax=Chondromyces apiculatus TaxID=51 RepID=UPI0005C75B05|nr:HNH endonuclease [Chondromyces apiculatus]
MTALTLMLTPWMVPHQIIPWQDAVTLSFLGKVDVLETYDDEIRSPSLTIRAPAVVRLKRTPGHIKRGVKFSRRNVFVRDDFRCQYCGARKSAHELNYDHVIPRVQGGKTVWENIVTSCYGCNGQKRGRTPEQAGMKLLRLPVKPKWLPQVPVVQLGQRRIPEVWSGYCGDVTAA